MVGARRFELPTSASRTLRANQAALRPDANILYKRKLSFLSKQYAGKASEKVIKMKYCVVIIDGAAGHPLPQRGGKTCSGAGPDS